MTQPSSLHMSHFGRLVAHFVLRTQKGDPVRWNCMCVCGRSVKVAENDLLQGHVKSCGCIDRIIPNTAPAPEYKSEMLVSPFPSMRELARYPDPATA